MGNEYIHVVPGCRNHNLTPQDGTNTHPALNSRHEGQSLWFLVRSRRDWYSWGLRTVLDILVRRKKTIEKVCSTVYPRQSDCVFAYELSCTDNFLLPSSWLPRAVRANGLPCHGSLQTAATLMAFNWPTHACWWMAYLAGGNCRKKMKHVRCRVLKPEGRQGWTSPNVIEVTAPNKVGD